MKRRLKLRQLVSTISLSSLFWTVVSCITLISAN